MIHTPCVRQQATSPACFLLAGVRVDTWVETGTDISPFYDSLIAKLMVHGKDRLDAVHKMQRALENTQLGGIPNNLEYLKAILAAEAFAAGKLNAFYLHFPHISSFQFDRMVCHSHPFRNRLLFCCKPAYAVSSSAVVRTSAAASSRSELLERKVVSVERRTADLCVDAQAAA